MNRRFLLIGAVFFLFSQLQAQSFTIKGTITDQQSKTPLNGATVHLKSIRDSAISQNLLSDSLGKFLFANLSPDSFLLSVSFVGFNTVTKTVKLDTSDIMLTISAVPNKSQELATVIITSTPPLAMQKGDTLQLSASQFKVNPDASAEDLMKKVPGVTIQNGQVQAHGENVQKVTIDGRELFGDDATAALRNLPAEVIDKIQIFDRLSDQAQFTGFDDGNTTKSINIITKANMRNGQFGRVFAGYGTDNHYLVGGNATLFKENRRISLVGNFNNINQQNFSQQDLLGVTSNAQRGGGNRGGGGQRSGGGNRGGSSGGGGTPGVGGGNFGNSGNFLVGQQGGINKTNSFGINYSDLWGPKITVTGSYLFNNTNNSTDQIANTQYFTGTTSNSLDTTLSNSRNINHRFNLRFEYKIDSANQLIISPNLSFQNNESHSYVGRESFFAPGHSLQRRLNQNTTNSNRSGNNLNNNILYRHAFAKKGRTFSINVNTSYNKRDGETYVNTFQRSFNNASFDDTTSQRFTDQASHGLQVSTNFAYTEPLGNNSQLQINYNPTFSKSISDQETYAFNNAENKYSNFLDSLSNKFENRTQSHNAGLAYRYGNRDRQLSFGMNYQYTNLKSDQTFPHKLNVDQSFNNILPNAMIRYKLSDKSNLRIFYRASVNQPSVTQLQNVLDITNAPFYSLGNPDLKQQYMNILSTRYTFTNPTKGLLFVGNVFLQSASNYITNATFTPTKDSVVGGQVLKLGDQLTKPVNLNGYTSLRTFLTFAVPVKFIKSNFNLNGGISLSNQPGLINNIENKTKNTTYTIGTVIASNISEYVDFTVSYTANFNKVKNAVVTYNNDNYFQQTAGVQLNLLSKKGWFFQNDLSNQYYNGLTQGYNQNYWLWNISVGKKIFKSQKGEIKASVFDLLKQNQSITRNVTESYIEDVQNQVLQQYFMLTFTYNLRNFGKAAARAMNRNNGNREFPRY